MVIDDLVGRMKMMYSKDVPESLLARQDFLQVRVGHLGKLGASKSMGFPTKINLFSKD